MYWPYFALGCNLEINSQRTSAYINNVSLIVSGGIGANIDMSCDCPALNYVYDVDDVPQIATYTTPAGDQAPWFDASISESARFLGFVISDVTQNSVASRSVVTRVSSSGGGSIGPIRNKERRLDFDVLMFACDEASMEYGFRYLTDALGSSGCDDSCALCTAEYRESCPPIQGGAQLAESLNRGRWLLKNVGLVEGPVWADAPIESLACNMRRVRFSLASELPWKFKCPVEVCSPIPIPAPVGPCSSFRDTAEVSCSVTEDLIIGETGMIINVHAGAVPLQHVKIHIRPDKFGYEAAPLTRPPGYIRVPPCDSIEIREIPAGCTLEYDTSVETVRILVPGGGSYDATSLIDTESGIAPTFPTVRCGDFCVSIMASECSILGNPYMSISSVHREI